MHSEFAWLLVRRRLRPLRRAVHQAYLFASGLRYWQLGRADLQQAPPPVLVGGTGGSGTRVVAQILAAAGFWIGGRLNHAYDALELIERYSDFWSMRSNIYRFPADPAVVRNMHRDLAIALMAHRAGIVQPQMPWGAKNPRLIVLLPHLYSCLPQLRFIHVLRDGRDHAFASRQWQLDAIGSSYLPALGGRLAVVPRPVQAAALWARVNLDAAAFAAARPDLQYLQVRLEDLCAWPEATLAQIFDFLAVPASAIAAARQVIEPPASLGRWRTQPVELQSAIERVAAVALDRFGYAR